MRLFILSPKSSIDIVTKDFAKNYYNTVKIYQNDMGYFDKSKQILKSSGENWVYLKYNEIVNQDNKYLMKNILKPIPIIFKSSYDLNERLQKSFNIVKSMIIQRIYRNNYSKHCMSKIVIDGEEFSESTNETNMNLCVILIEHSKDVI